MNEGPGGWHFIHLTSTTLHRIGAAEAGLRALGFCEVRVRHYGDTAGVELGLGELDEALAKRLAIVEALPRTAATGQSDGADFGCSHPKALGFALPQAARPRVSAARPGTALEIPVPI